MVKDLKEGSLVRTIDISTTANKELDTWTRATDVTIYDGMWEAHLFTFSTGHNLTVTFPHLMIIWKEEVPYFVRADQVQIGDEMKIGEKIIEVNRIDNNVINSKVAVETEDGTLEVNGVLASGLCDDNPDVMKMVMKVKPMIKNYKSSHFGEEYNIKCMNSHSWRSAYQINNGISI